MNNPFETVEQLLRENLEDGSRYGIAHHKIRHGLDVASLLVLNLKQMAGDKWREDLRFFSFKNPQEMTMNLKRFWEYYKPVVDALNTEDFGKAIEILDKMVEQEGICDRWKQLVLRFVSAGGELPSHLDAMMLLGENDEWLKEYVGRKTAPKRKTA